MANKAVFLDRDGTVMADPGYRTGPEAVSLLPGVELALKSLAQAGYRLVLVTNQPGVAFGRHSEQAVRATHDALRKQIDAHGARLDAAYYCPHHPEGTVEAYARDCDDRKPRPGMLNKAAADMGLKLADCWMVGDSPRDIEAGQRAGCRTIRLKSPGEDTSHGGEGPGDEDLQADFTVRNLVDASRVILREAGRGPVQPAAAAEPAGPVVAARSTAPAQPGETPPPLPEPASPKPASTLSDSEVLHEILKLARQWTRRHQHRAFSVGKLIGGVCQGLAILAAVVTAVKWADATGGPRLTEFEFYEAGFWLGATGVAQLAALTFFLMGRDS